MARTMQDLSEFVFVTMANFTLATHDSYLDHLKSGIKHDILAMLRHAPLHLAPLFPDSAIHKAEDEIAQYDDKCYLGGLHKKLGRYHPYLVF